MYIYKRIVINLVQILFKLNANVQHVRRGGKYSQETFYGKIIEPAIIVNTPTYFLIKVPFKTPVRGKQKGEQKREKELFDYSDK